MAYLDDILIIGKMYEEHLDNLRRALAGIRDAGLRLKPHGLPKGKSHTCNFCMVLPFLQTV